MTILQRWIMAADRLGWSGFASQGVNEVVRVLETCAEPDLALEVRAEGPRALGRLDMDQRHDLAAKIEPVLAPRTRQLLQSESREMERDVGTKAPLRLIVFGRASSGKDVADIIAHEFANQRGAAITLHRPTSDTLNAFHLRHQLLWPEPEAGGERSRPVPRLPVVPRNQKYGLWDFRDLACLSFTDHRFYTQFARDCFVAMEPERILHYGSLRMVGLLDEVRSDLVADLAFAAGRRTFPDAAAVAFFKASEGRPPVMTLSGQGRTCVFLGEAQEGYARVDFAPHEKSLNVSIQRWPAWETAARTTLTLDKERVIAQGLERLRNRVTASLWRRTDDCRTESQRKRTDRRITQTAAIAESLAVRYLEWLEWKPEAFLGEREDTLAALEGTVDGRDVFRRDVHRALQMYLTGWGLRFP